MTVGSVVLHFVHGGDPSSFLPTRPDKLCKSKPLSASIPFNRSQVAVSKAESMAQLPEVPAVQISLSYRLIVFVPQSDANDVKMNSLNR